MKRYLAGLLLIGVLAYFYYGSSDGSEPPSVKKETAENKFTTAAPAVSLVPAVTTAAPAATSKVTTTKAPEKVTSKAPAATSKDDGDKTFVDDRIPNYVPSAKPDWQEIRFEWQSFDKLYNFNIYFSIDKNAYKYYHGLTRYIDPGDYKNYISDASNQEIVNIVLSQLRKLGDQCGYTESQLVQEVINFVQNITYSYDIDSTGKIEFPKYPMETLYDRCGDCEDSAILMAAFFKAMGYGSAILHYEGHIAIGIQGDPNISGYYYEVGGKRYYYIETTNPGWKIGDIPDQYKNESAEIFVL